MNIMKGLKGGRNAHSEYQSVEDQKDLRIPVQNEDAFKVGILYKAKYIGTQEITRPSNRVEIVSAMRRIRYEYKYRNIKKRKVNVVISVDGIKVTIWKKSKSIQAGKYDESQLFVMCYPINRVFYVSHDSQDLLILSFIARGDDGIFRCSVFKAFRKAQAMSVVRTIGQAFEVCHKLNQVKNVEEGKEIVDVEKEQAAQNEENDIENIADEVEETDIDDLESPLATPSKVTQSAPTLVTDLDQAEEGAQTAVPKIPTHLLNGKAGNDATPSATLAQLHQLYRQQLMHQANEVAAAKAEVNMLKQQLKIETDYRVDAQSRVEQLLSQNRELLVTVQKLMSQLENVPAKNLFDPVDEKWILSSGAPSDCFLPGRSMPALANNITNECLSNVFDNQHYQSMDLGSGLSNFSSNQNSQSVSPSHSKTEAENTTGQKQMTFVEYSNHSSENLGEVKLTEHVKEGKGGLSTSFTDLRTIGTIEEQIDHNHNNDHITKFSPNSNDVIVESNQIEDANHVFSKEMMETFSEEINEMDKLIPKQD